MNPIQVMNEYALGFALTNCLFLSLLRMIRTGKGVVACVYVQMYICTYSTCTVQYTYIHTYLVLYICMRRKREQQQQYKYKHIK